MLTIATTGQARPIEREVYPIIRGLCQESAEILGQAFQDDPTVCAVFPALPGEERARRLTIGFAEELAACLKRGYPLCVWDNDRIAAAAIIHPPRTFPLPLVEQLGILRRAVREGGSYGLDRWIIYLSETKKWHPKQDHYYLELLGVKPGLQGNGFGSTILKELVRKADEDRAGCCLETANPRNLPLYERFGFQVVQEKTIIGVNTWFMWRPPGEAEAASGRKDPQPRVPRLVR